MSTTAHRCEVILVSFKEKKVVSRQVVVTEALDVAQEKWDDSRKRIADNDAHNDMQAKLNAFIIGLANPNNRSPRF